MVGWMGFQKYIKPILIVEMFSVCLLFCLFIKFFHVRILQALLSFASYLITVLEDNHV